MTNWITNIVSTTGKEKTNSGFIANNDVTFFASKLGFQKLNYIREDKPSESEAKNLQVIEELLRPLKAGDNVFVQFPTWQSLKVEILFFQVLFRKNVSVVLLVWDVLPWLHDASERDFSNEYAFKIMKQSDLVITPNAKMQKRLEKEAAIVTPMIPMGFWDFKIHTSVRKKTDSFRKVYFAGTLDKTDFSQYQGTVPIYLLGDPNGLTMKEKEQSNLVVLGEFANQDLPEQFSNGFGLISYVGGGSDQKQRFKGAEKYGYYNTPLKLSLYLANDLPVIVPSNSAHAEIIRKENIGFVLDDLNDLDFVFRSMTDEDYQIMQQQVTKFKNKITNGHFTKKAFQQAIEYLDSLKK